MATKVISGTITGGYTLSSMYDTLSIKATGEISGGVYGIFSNHSATIINSGAIIDSSGVGIRLNAGGSVSNGTSTNNTALINQGVYILKSGGTVKNFGTIESSRINSAGVYITSGMVNNGAPGLATALIMGVNYGVSVGPGAVTVTNFGIIAAAGGAAVAFTSASDLLTVEAGSSIVGAVHGGGGTLQLASGIGAISGLGTSFSGFGYYVTQNGGSWTSEWNQYPRSCDEPDQPRNTVGQRIAQRQRKPDQRRIHRRWRWWVRPAFGGRIIDQ